MTEVGGTAKAEVLICEQPSHFKASIEFSNQQKEAQSASTSDLEKISLNNYIISLRSSKGIANNCVF
jgi:hypothetical protein